MILAEMWENIPKNNTGYIAGTDDGIVTVGGVLAARRIFVFNARLGLIRITHSLASGHYFINNLDQNQKYLIMARDLPPTDGVERYEPAVWDYVTPMTDKTIDEQIALWQSFND